MNELIAQLTKNLNVDQAQAEGGVGAIFELVKKNLANGDFSTLSQAMPGIEQMISKAPPQGSSSGIMGGLMGAATSLLGNNSQLGGLAQLAGAFKALNIDMDTALKFAPIVKQFAETQGGPMIKQLIEKALSGKS